jgi:hypothetical protein
MATAWLLNVQPRSIEQNQPAIWQARRSHGYFT